MRASSRERGGSTVPARTDTPPNRSTLTILDARVRRHALARRLVGHECHWLNLDPPRPQRALRGAYRNCYE
jgi:hypothetical protein